MMMLPPMIAPCVACVMLLSGTRTLLHVLVTLFGIADHQITGESFLL